MEPSVEIDPGAGFCYGVEEVVKEAEDALERGEKLYGLGEMVHNAREVERLSGLGLRTITHEDLAGLSGIKVLFRAHGEAPEVYELARSRNIQIMDGTCPIVLKLQERIRKAYDQMDHEREQLVIFGKKTHPETIALLGQVGGNAVVLGGLEDVELVDPQKSTVLFSQTTMDPDTYKLVEEALQERGSLAVRTAFRSHCGICAQMKRRKPGLKAFARRTDVVVFMSGTNSANGQMLFEYCREFNPRTHWISSVHELKATWFEGASLVGISGATSTSREQLETVRLQVQKIISS